MDINWERTSFEVNEWFVEPDHLRNAGVIQLESEPAYSISISTYNHKEPDVYYITISVSSDTKTEYEVYSFKSKTTSVYKIPIPREVVPIPELIFIFVEKAGFDYTVEFDKRKVRTLNQNRKIPKPIIEVQRQGIQAYIDHWDKNVRHTALQ